MFNSHKLLTHNPLLPDLNPTTIDNTIRYHTQASSYSWNISNYLKSCFVLPADFQALTWFVPRWRTACYSAVHLDWFHHPSQQSLEQRDSVSHQSYNLQKIQNLYFFNQDIYNNNLYCFISSPLKVLQFYLPIFFLIHYQKLNILVGSLLIWDSLLLWFDVQSPKSNHKSRG